MAMTRGQGRGGGRRRRGVRRGASAGLALALALGGVLAGSGPGLAQAWRCVPGSIGPQGCESIRPQDRPPARPAFVPPPLSERMLDEIVRAPDPDGVPRMILPMPGVSTRHRPPPELPGASPPRDTRALQRYQAPYVRDGRRARPRPARPLEGQGLD